MKLQIYSRGVVQQTDMKNIIIMTFSANEIADIFKLYIPPPTVIPSPIVPSNTPTPIPPSNTPIPPTPTPIPPSPTTYNPSPITIPSPTPMPFPYFLISLGQTTAGLIPKPI